MKNAAVPGEFLWLYRRFHSFSHHQPSIIWLQELNPTRYQEILAIDSVAPLISILL